MAGLPAPGLTDQTRRIRNCPTFTAHSQWALSLYEVALMPLGNLIVLHIANSFSKWLGGWDSNPHCLTTRINSSLHCQVCHLPMWRHGRELNPHRSLRQRGLPPRGAPWHKLRRLDLHQLPSAYETVAHLYVLHRSEWRSPEPPRKPPACKAGALLVELHPHMVAWARVELASRWASTSCSSGELHRHWHVV